MKKMEKKMQISVIIVNYNTLELTKNTIQSIIDKTKEVKYEIILVDNDSNDGSKDYFSKDYYKTQIKFIKNDENLGFGKANNIGINLAKGKYIFLLNSDTLLINNSLKILFDFMEKNNDVGICGANLYDEEKFPTHSYGRLPNAFMDINDFCLKIYYKIFKKRLDFNYKNEVKQVGYITGADMFIRKSALDSVGTFDSDFFMYFEETELTSRIKKQGYKIFSVPEAKIIHLEGKSFKFKETRFSMMCESKYKYLYKVYGKKQVLYNYIISQIKYTFLFNEESRVKKIINKQEYKKIKMR